MAQSGPKWAQPVVDYAGIVAFGGTYLVTRDLLTASWGLAAGSAIGLLVGFATQKRLALLPLMTGASAIIFASLSLIFHNTLFIGLKLTIIDGLIAAALFIGLGMGKQPLKRMLGDTLKISDSAWRQLTLRYAIFFVLIAIANIVLFFVTRGTPREGWWVAFRTLGVPILAALFTFTQLPLLMRDMQAHHDENAPEDIEPPPAD